MHGGVTMPDAAAEPVPEGAAALPVASIPSTNSAGSWLKKQHTRRKASEDEEEEEEEETGPSSEAS